MLSPFLILQMNLVFSLRKINVTIRTMIVWQNTIHKVQPETCYLVVSGTRNSDPSIGRTGRSHVGNFERKHGVSGVETIS
jgi:hypothetical protein